MSNKREEFERAVFNALAFTILAMWTFFFTMASINDIKVAWAAGGALAWLALVIKFVLACGTLGVWIWLGMKAWRDES